MNKLESAKEIIRQDGNCVNICCNDCIQNKEGIIPCEYAESLALCDSEKYFKATVDFCKEWLKENEMKFKVGEPNLKVGDYVSSKLFKGVKQIVRDVNDMHDWYVLKGSSKKYYSGELELVCGFKKGEKVKVSDFDETGDCSSSYEAIFVSYENDYTYKYLVELENKNGDSYLHTFKYAKPITEKKYKQYEKANYAWIDKKVVDNFGTVSTIKMVGKDCVNFKQNDNEETCYDLFKRYTWEDGSVCGEEI